MRAKSIAMLDHRMLKKIEARSRRQRAERMAILFVNWVDAVAGFSRQIRRTAAACTAARLHRKDKNRNAYGTA